MEPYHWKDPGLGEFQGMSPDRVRRLLFEAERAAHSHFRSHPAWLFAADVFRVGPKVALNLCEHAGLDPHLTVRSQQALEAGPPG